MRTYHLLSDVEMERLMQEGEDGYDYNYEEGESDDDPMPDPVTSNALYAICDAIYRRRGLFYGLVAGVCAGMQMGVVGWLRSSISPSQIMLCRGLIFLLPVVFIAWDAGANYTAADMAYYIGYGVFNALGVLLGYVALQFAQVGNVTVITFNLPIPSTILGFIVLREEITGFDILLFAFNLTGIVLVSKPPFIFGAVGDLGFDESIGAIIAIAALLSIVISAILSRKLAYREHSDPALSTVVPGMVATLLSSGVILFTQTWNTPSTPVEIVAIPLAGTFGLLANLFLILALRLESVLVVSVLTTICIPVSFIVGVFAIHDIPDLVSIVGAILVVASTCGCLCK